MKICFKVPFNSWLNGPSAESLNLHTFFEEKVYLVKVNIEGNDPLVLEKGSPETKHFCKTTFITFEVTLKDEASEHLEEFKLLITEEANRLKLFSLLVNIVNRMLRSIRNFGIVAHLQEIRPRNDDLEPFFRKWDVKYSDNGTDFHFYYPQTVGLLEFGRIYSSVDEDTPSMNVSDWPDIEEAIQDHLDPAPEQEFFTNAIEFLRTRNFRMSLLESVICLEIVLTQYLKAFLSVRKEISNSRINKFLTPQLGLSSRLSGLLDLTLRIDDLKKFNIQKILQAVGWRNYIIHKTGNLPVHLKEEALSEGISSVIGLSMLLAQRRDQILAEPELQIIAKKVSENNKTPLPTIWAMRKHNILIEVQFYFDQLPESDVLAKVSNDLSVELKARDHRFDADKHLYVRFMQFPKKIIARWRHGALEIIEEKPKK